MKSPIRYLASVVKRTLRRAGYAVVRSELIGSNPFEDVKQLLCDEVAIIFDVGANVGQTSHQLRTHFPRATVYAFEPYPPAFDALRARFDGVPNFEAHNLGLGATDGRKTLFVNKSSLGNSFLRISEQATAHATHDWTKPAGTVEISVRTLDSFCRENTIPAIDLLKVDAQGYEGHILEGATTLLAGRKVRAVYVEVLFIPLYDGQDSFESVYGKLHAHGYQFVSFYNVVRHQNSYVMWCDALFIAT